MITNTNTAIAKVLRAAGFDRLANDVAGGRAEPSRALEVASNMSPTHRPALQAALKLIGGRKIDHNEIRAYIEGRAKWPGRKLS